MSGEAPESGTGPPPTDPPAAVQVPNASIHVFISYASQDAAVARALVEALERHGVACWIAPRDVKAGAQYADAIVRAIGGAKAIVVVLSESAIASSHVGREIERASSKKRPIIALRIDAAPLTPALEYFLSESQWVEAQAGSMEAAYAKLIDAIRDPTGTAPRNTPAMPLEVSTAPAPVAHPKSRSNLILFAAGIGFVVAALLVYKFWISSHVAQEKPVATTSLVPAAGAPAQSTISEKSVAVLPFLDMSEKRDQEYFADGMAEEIIDLLANVSELRVPARTSSFYFKGKSAKVPDIARELGVRHVLEGSIRRSGDRLRVTAQLVRADNGYHLWSETYDRDAHEVFKVQSDIANAVVQALRISLMGGPLTRPQGGTQNLEAYQLYLRGVSSGEQGTRSGHLAAREYFKKAIDRDPGFGLAWKELSGVVVALAQDGSQPRRESYESALQLARHALEVSPDLAVAHAQLQYLHRTYEWDWAASEAEGRQALALDPTNPLALVFTGALSYTLGRWDDAEHQIRLALVRDPFFTLAIWHLAKVQYLAGHFADAEATYQRLLELAPDYLQAHSYLAKTLLAEGKPEAALAMVQQERDEDMRLQFLAIILQAVGRQAESDEALRALITKFADSDAYSIAMAYAYRNDRDLAIEWLERAYSRKDDGFVTIVGEPLFKNLKDDPRFKALLRKANLPEYQFHEIPTR
jgi:TolB-like protein/Tfp pilus assembly protein PilF